MQAGAMQERVDTIEASGLGRMGLVPAGPESALAGSTAGAIDPATFAFLAPAIDDHMRAEFYG
jgi:hypothetical protein